MGRRFAQLFADEQRIQESIDEQRRIAPALTCGAGAITVALSRLPYAVMLKQRSIPLGNCHATRSFALIAKNVPHNEWALHDCL